MTNNQAKRSQHINEILIPDLHCDASIEYSLFSCKQYPKRHH